MATMDDLDELALGLPQTERRLHRGERVEYAVHGKVFCRHREPRKDALDPATGERLDDVLMLSTEHVEAKEMLLADPRGVWFTTPHFDGYAAILVRISDLGRLSRDDLDDVVVEAWLAKAPKRVAKAWLAEQDGAGPT